MGNHKVTPTRLESLLAMCLTTSRYRTTHLTIPVTHIWSGGSHAQRGASSKRRGNFRGRSRRSNGRAPFIPRPVAQPQPFADIGAEGPYPELSRRKSMEPLSSRLAELKKLKNKESTPPPHEKMEKEEVTKVVDAADTTSLAESSPASALGKKDPFRKAKSPIRIEKPSSIQVSNEGDGDTFGMVFDEELDAMFGENGFGFCGTVSVLPFDFQGDPNQPWGCLEGDCDDIIPKDECKFVEDGLIKEGLFERPDEIIKGHLRPLHIKAKVEGLVINRILVDGGNWLAMRRKVAQCMVLISTRHPFYC
ncbi:hypothetical protein PIB30_074769 [Stylosanthes scabra]|uniref:Uncharacterized protein n=1 Tax=Stylosanthes scabra TaxID=79078 RepID=A0ABU6YQI1_9FABA|nr:hypothetical protein [Stylosanthes scabra]